VKIAGEFTIGNDGRNVKPVDSGGGVARTITVLELAALFDGEDESVAFSDTVKAWVLVKV
jgi:hypothetical protein